MLLTHWADNNVNRLILLQISVQL